MIAIRVAAERGVDVGLAAEVRDPDGGDYWTVFVPEWIPGSDPGGVLVLWFTNRLERQRCL